MTYFNHKMDYCVIEEKRGNMELRPGRISSDRVIKFLLKMFQPPFHFTFYQILCVDLLKIEEKFLSNTVNLREFTDY
jgi:hypothetical protein